MKKKEIGISDKSVLWRMNKKITKVALFTHHKSQKQGGHHAERKTHPL
jgi:hypothetical protein